MPLIELVKRWPHKSACLVKLLSGELLGASCFSSCGSSVGPVAHGATGMNMDAVSLRGPRSAKSLEWLRLQLSELPRLCIADCTQHPGDQPDNGEAVLCHRQRVKP